MYCCFFSVEGVTLTASPNQYCARKLLLELFINFPSCGRIAVDRARVDRLGLFLLFGRSGAKDGGTWCSELKQDLGLKGLDT